MENRGCFFRTIKWWETRSVLYVGPAQFLHSHLGQKQFFNIPCSGYSASRAAFLVPSAWTKHGALNLVGISPNRMQLLSISLSLCLECSCWVSASCWCSTNSFTVLLGCCLCTQIFFFFFLSSILAGLPPFPWPLTPLPVSPEGTSLVNHTKAHLGDCFWGNWSKTDVQRFHVEQRDVQERAVNRSPKATGAIRKHE